MCVKKTTRSLPPAIIPSYELLACMNNPDEPDDPFVTDQHVLLCDINFKNYIKECTFGKKGFMFIQLVKRYVREKLFAKTLHFPVAIPLDQVDFSFIVSFGSKNFLTQETLFRFLLYVIDKPSALYSNADLQSQITQVRGVMKFRLPTSLDAYHDLQSVNASIEFATYLNSLRLNFLRLNNKLTHQSGEFLQRKMYLINIINNVIALFKKEAKQRERILGAQNSFNGDEKESFARLCSPLPFMWFYLEEARYFWQELFDCIASENAKKSNLFSPALRSLNQALFNTPLKVFQRPSMAGQESNLEDYLNLWESLELKEEEILSYQKLIAYFISTWQLMEKDKDFSYWQQYLPDKEFFAQLELEWHTCHFLKKKNDGFSLLTSLSQNHPLPRILANRRKIEDISTAQKSGFWNNVFWGTKPPEDIFLNYQFPRELVYPTFIANL